MSDNSNTTTRPQVPWLLVGGSHDHREEIIKIKHQRTILVIDL